MSTVEIIVIAACLAVGYKFTSAMLVKSKDSATPDRVPEPAVRFDAPLPWHEVLGVSPEATHEQIVAAYRSRMSQYHPDKVANLGADIRKLAEQRATEINAAYAQACAIRPG